MDTSDRDEALWIRRAQQGDRAAFGLLVRAHQDRLYRYLLRLTGSREEALELAQDALVKAWQSLPDWRPEARFSTWLFQIGSNAAIDLLRRRKTVSFTALDDYEPASGDAGPEASAAARQSLRSLEKALARLPFEQRQVLLLREVEGLSYAEIAQSLGTREGTVKSRLARARESLLVLHGGPDA